MTHPTTINPTTTNAKATETSHRATEQAVQNKALLEAAYAETAEGKADLFRELFAEQVTWSKIGTTSWSGSYEGLSKVRAMFTRLYELLDGPHIVRARRLIAEGDLVVVEAQSESRTKAGKPYYNSYCMVFRLADGRIREVKEYCDTALVDAVL